MGPFLLELRTADQAEPKIPLNMERHMVIQLYTVEPKQTGHNSKDFYRLHSAIFIAS